MSSGRSARTRTCRKTPTRRSSSRRSTPWRPPRRSAPPARAPTSASSSTPTARCGSPGSRRNPPHAQGTGYALRRRNGSAGNFIFVGTSGKKEFIDRTIPAGTSVVTYEVQGQRSGINGPVSQFTVQFGMAGNGQATVSITDGQNGGDVAPLHIAA
ncbi:MAG: hypothetical protein K2Q09_05145 [Phycisphaerales bacterium]|nr:hypothetical protein [Phycisphaerales bacterium]